jgi:DNA-binding PadR family transcriptional regulator
MVSLNAADRVGEGSVTRTLLKRAAILSDGDLDLLAALFHLGVLDHAQARMVAYPDLHPRAVYRRLRRLLQAGFIRADRIAMDSRGGASALYQLAADGVEVARQHLTAESWPQPALVVWRGSRVWRRSHHALVVSVYAAVTRRLGVGWRGRMRWAWPSERRSLVAGERERRVQVEPDLLLLAWSDEARRHEVTCVEADTGSMGHGALEDKLVRYRRLCAAARGVVEPPLAWMDPDWCRVLVVCGSERRAEGVRGLAAGLGLVDSGGESMVDVVASPEAAADVLAAEYLGGPSGGMRSGAGS